MSHVRIDAGCVLGKHFRQVYENLFLRQDAQLLARAYEGVHDPGFAEPEFAGKYMEICACYARVTGDQSALEKAATVAESAIRNQRADGYLGCYAPGNEFKSFSVWNQAFTCLGLIAYWDAADDARALQAAESCVAYLAAQFGEKHPLLASGNQGSQHLALLFPAVQLYLRTKNESYLRFCRRMIQDCTENPTFDFLSNPYVLGVASQKGIEMLAFMMGVCLYSQAAEDSACFLAVQRYWQDLKENQITNTGCGTVSENWRPHGNQPAMLPLEIRPNENCVAVGWMELSLMLYQITGESRYFDAVEQALYNHLLGSKAPDGSDFAYYQGNYGTKIIAKNPRSYSCCRFRGLTMMAHLPDCAVWEGENSLTFALYTAFEQSFSVGGVGVKAAMQTEYPALGKISLRLQPERPMKLTLKFRIPGWCEGFSLQKDGEACETEEEKGHAVWRGDIPARGITLELNLAMKLRWVEAVIDSQTVLSAEYGPLLLAIDSHFGTPIYTTTVDGEGTAERFAPDSALPVMAAFRVPGSICGEETGVALIDYASAGMHAPGRDKFRVWIPKTGTDMEGLCS